MTWELTCRVRKCLHWDDLGAFQRMLSSGEISLDSVGCNGKTLMVRRFRLNPSVLAIHLPSANGQYVSGQSSKTESIDIPLFLLEHGYKPNAKEARLW